MALLTRLRARASFQPADANNNPQPASKPRKLVKKRSSRASSAEPSAPDGPVNPDAWREPTPAPARRTWKESPYKLSPATNPILATMKPLGEFPSAAEYRAVNLIPPSVKKNRAAKSLQQQALHVVAEAIESDTPMTPLAEEAVADVPRLDVEMENVEPISEVETRKNSVEDSVGADAMEDAVAEVDDAIATNLATPVSEAVDGKQTARTSISPATDTLAADAVIPPATQPTSPGPETPLETLITATSPLPDAQTTSAPALFKGPRKKTDVGMPDYVGILNSIPLPSSTEYDVSQLKRVIEAAITHALEKGESEIALCLVYYWSRSSNDSFLLSLIDNIGRKEPNYQLDLALKTVLRNSRADAIEWIRKKSIKERTTRRTRAAAADSDSNLSEAKSIDPNKPNQTKPAARKPVPTAFEKGKSNTVPLQKPKNRAPFLEKFHKRREEWENDEGLGDELRKKRQKLSQDQQDAGFPNAKVSLCRSTLNKGADRTDQDESARQQYRSLSIDTHLSDMSILSDSACSERINDWVAPHDPRYMPNQIEPPENSDNCLECGKGGSLLCCEGCENALHFRCVKPPIDPKNPPSGDWFCPKCTMRNNFTEAICHSQYFNKTEFQVATPIKEYFAGVGEGVVTDERYGSDPKHLRFYKSVPHLPRLTKPPTKPAEYYSTPAYNDPNLLREMDAQGKLISCMKCGRGTGGERPIISCDYCPCRFHLDCLDPPRAIPTNPYVGWMCPNHVTPDDMIAIKEQEDGGEHVRRIRRPKNMRSIDVDVSFSDNPEKTLFDDEWRERRARLPAGDLILEFIDTVKLDRSRREKEHMLHVERQCMSMARIITMEYYRRLGIDDPAQVVSEHGVSPEIADGISTVVKQSMDGKTPDHEAATVLLALAHTGTTSSTTAGEDGIAEASQPTDSHQDALTSPNAAISSQANEPNSKSDEGITIGSSQNATASFEAPQTSEPTTAPPLTFDDSASESSDPDTLPKVPNLPGFNPKASRGRKRFLTETETLATEEEPAQKRQHVESAPKEQSAQNHAAVDADGDSDMEAARPNDPVIVNDEDKDAPTWGSSDQDRLQSAEQLESDQIVKDLKDRLKGVDTMLREGQTDPEMQIGLLDEIEGLSKVLRGRIGGQSQLANQHAQPAEEADGEKEL